MNTFFLLLFVHLSHAHRNPSNKVKEKKNLYAVCSSSVSLEWRSYTYIKHEKYNLLTKSFNTLEDGCKLHLMATINQTSIKHCRWQ